MYSFAALDKKARDIEERIKQELAGIRASRAAPALLDGILVEAYGAWSPLNQIGTVSIEDPRTLRVSLFDPSNAKNAEKAIIQSNLGLAVAADDRGIRISFPELTADRRASLIKVAKEKLEQSKMSLRALRDEVWKDIQGKEKQGGMGEDEKFRLKKEMEKHIDETAKRLEEGFKRKEREILG